MSIVDEQPEWYYVGHYGQLGPLTFQQISELVSDGVIDRETYLWRPGMADWQPAGGIFELRDKFGALPQQPPPTPMPGTRPSPTVQSPTPSISTSFVPNPEFTPAAAPYGGYPMPYGTLNTLKSDKKRAVAGLLNFIPGFGRFYLGYAAHGMLQLITTMCFVGLIWAWLDAIYILVGGLRHDGYGRELVD
ncbi:MAG: GYF domain-containing protein [Armatimonadetes bacterium]|nr:GYF domain-containing protein [Armatimonadota bacterium]